MIVRRLLSLACSFVFLFYPLDRPGVYTGYCGCTGDLASTCEVWVGVGP